MNIEHSYPFDPTNGKTLEDLKQIPPGEEVASFRAFWEENYALTMAMRPTYFIEREVWSPDPEVRIYKIRAKNFDNTEFCMWISRPEKSRGGILAGQGYGNPATPPCYNGVTYCFPCVRGLGISQCKEIPWDSKKHVLHGIASKETYILRGVISDLWMAASVMLDMFPDTAEHLAYTGSSMGGGMGALMLPWDPRFHAGFLGVPTFGAPCRFDYESTGSGEACRQYLQTHPEALEVLQYFDASVSAKYLKSIPVAVAPAQFDPCVNPVGQFSVANAIPAEKKTLFVRETGHFPATEKDKATQGEIDLWSKKYIWNEEV
ncbi:MAG: acetylxylan esterase [Lentisphaeria bacterium]|nr:acetylxylan esterase [Lentisphaeria bacterium]